MKKFSIVFAFLGIMLFASSCNLDDDTTNFHFEALKITAADLPESFEFGKVYDFNVTYEKPSSCYVFQGFDYRHTGTLERTVTAIAAVYEDRACTLEVSEEVGVLKFEVRFKGTYTFNFWTGEDENGNDQYITIEVPVVEEN